MDKDEILNRLQDLLFKYFPDEPVPDGPYWGQRPYEDWLRDLCIQAYGIVGRDDVRDFVDHQWNISRLNRLPTAFSRQIGQLVDAWGDWQSEHQKRVEGEQKSAE